MIRFSLGLLFTVLFVSSLAAQSGGSWTTLRHTPGVTGFGISCFDEENCIIIADSAGFNSQVLRTTDGGATWHTILVDRRELPHKLYMLRFEDVAYMDSATCFVVVRDSSIILRTFNGGAHWDTVRVPLSIGRIRTIAMRDKNFGYLSGPQRWLFKTTDGWNNRVQIPLPDTIPTSSIQDIAAPDDSTIILLMSDSGTMHTFRSTNAGSDWTIAPGPALSSQLAFANAQRGVAVGSENAPFGSVTKDILHRTDDGGATWEMIIDREIPEPYGLLNVAFADAENAIAVGRSRKILRTRDGGRTWEQQIYPDSSLGLANMGYIAFPSLARAYAASSDDRIIGYSEAPSGVLPVTAPHPDQVRYHMHPNPVNSGETTEISLGARTTMAVDVRLVDLLGISVKEFSHILQEGELATLPVRGPSAPGIYFVIVSSSNTIHARIPLVVR